MKILVLNYEYPPLGGGGGVVAANIAESYVNSGHEVIVVTSGIASVSFYENRKNLEIYRLPVFRQSFAVGKIYQMFFYILFALPMISFLIFRRKINFIHLHFLLPTGVLGYFAKKVFGIPYIVTLHGGDVPSHFPEATSKFFKYFIPLANLIIRNSEKCVAVSESLYQLAVNDFKAQKEKITWIDNGVTVHKNYKVKFSQPLNFVFSGRLSKEKNILPVITILTASNYDFIFDILGDGEQMPEITQFLHVKKEKRIRMHGWVDNKKISVFYKTAHFMIMNSKMEGLSMAALEAMSYGIPIISSDCEGMKKIIDGGKNGFLFHNEKELLSIIEDIYSDDFEKIYIQLRQNTFEIANKKYNVRNAAEKYLEIMKNEESDDE